MNSCAVIGNNAGEYQKWINTRRIYCTLTFGNECTKTSNYIDCVRSHCLSLFSIIGFVWHRFLTLDCSNSCSRVIPVKYPTPFFSPLYRMEIIEIVIIPRPWFVYICYSVKRFVTMHLPFSYYLIILITHNTRVPCVIDYSTK